MPIDSIESVKQYLENLPKFQSMASAAAKFDLERFREFCNAIGDPHRKFSSVHVAGTNGKGSTCRILGTVYQRSGYKAGVYTSPHILHFNERFTINGQTIPDAQLVQFFREFEELINRFGLTYFEISTAIAFWWFARAGVDIAIIEVGLGGRLDATNVIDPEVSVITSIALDHTDLLGDSFAEIAREKAGIIKPGKSVVIGNLPEEAVSEIVSIAEQNESNYYTIAKLEPEFLGGGAYRMCADHSEMILSTNLNSPVQAYNLAMAWRVVQLMQKQLPVSRRQFSEALRKLDPAFGRFNRLREDQNWFFDGGHNLEAVRMLKQAIREIAPVNQAILILSLMKDKARAEVLEEFSEFKKIYYYPLGFERAAKIDDIKQLMPTANLFPADEDQQQLLFKSFNSELVIFAGSFYFYSKVRDWIKTFA